MMQNEINETVLSSYMDGELTPDKMKAVDDYIEKSGSARNFLLNSVRITAFMRATLKIDKDSAIPEKSLSIQAAFQDRRKNIIQIVAAILIVFSFIAGRFVTFDGPDVRPSIAGGIPSKYFIDINEALENNKSMDSLSRYYIKENVTLVVTPVKTYITDGNTFYREYDLVIDYGDYSMKIAGVASRKKKNEWETKALFFNNYDI